jgi:membrane associated rhomboid family serine protease
MGIYDRDYVKDDRPRGGGYGGEGFGGHGSKRARFGAPGAWSVNTWLIVSNVAIHILAVTVFSTGGGPGGRWSLLHQYGHFSTAKGFFEIVQRVDHTGQVVNAVQLNLQVWRLLTFQFLHDPNTILHLFFNMFGLWIFGPMVEETLGRRKYLAFYLVCGIMGGVMYVFLNLLGMTGLPLPGVLTTPPTTPLVGASAGVFGVIMACAYVSPNTIVQLIFLPIPLKMKWLAYGYVGISLFNLLISGRNAGGDAAHVGGAIAGYFFIRNPHHLLDFFDILGNSKAPKKPRGGRAGRSTGRSGPRAPSQDEVDRILDKVNLKGIQSLTAKEKKVLERASRGARD